MDAANWRPTQGPDPNAADPAGGDWRAQLHPEERSRIVNKIMETLKKHLPVSVPEGLNELQKIAVRFEEKIYTAATNQSDYLRKISLKLLSMETKTQQPPGNAQVIQNQNPSGPGVDQASSAAMGYNTRLVSSIRSKTGNQYESNRSMDAANWRPTQGPDPNAADPAGGDWRAQLQPEVRSRIVNNIMETLKKHLPVSVPEGLNELQKIAVRFEEKIYTAATNQSDYLRKISLKLLSLETKTQQPSGNAQVIPNQNPSGPEKCYQGNKKFKVGGKNKCKRCGELGHRQDGSCPLNGVKKRKSRSKKNTGPWEGPSNVTPISEEPINPTPSTPTRSHAEMLMGGGQSQATEAKKITPKKIRQN